MNTAVAGMLITIFVFVIGVMLIVVAASHGVRAACEVVGLALLVLAASIVVVIGSAWIWGVIP